MLQRRTPLAPRRKRKRMIKPERAVDLAHLARVRRLPCVVCFLLGIMQTSPSDSHHIKRHLDGTKLGMGQKSPDCHAIPLCRGRHHWNGAGVNMSMEEFEAICGDEIYLLGVTQAMLLES
jgi:hypothetical protein